MKQATRNKQKKRKVRRSQRWLFPLLALLMAAAVLSISLFVSQKNQLKLDAPVYQYFLSQKYDYAPGTRVLMGKYNVVFRTGNQQNDGDPSPIYYRDETAVLLPSHMSWLDPVSGQEWLIPALSRLKLDHSGSVWCQIEGQEILLSGGFLFDCAGTYLMLDSVALTSPGQRSQLSPFSFCSTAGGQSRLYEYETETFTWKTEPVSYVINQSTQDWQLDLTAAIYISPDGIHRLLSADPQLLTDIRQR